MTKKIVNWECDICELDNVVEVDESQGKIKVNEKQIYCTRCGVANIPQPQKGLVNKPGGQWLPCLPLPGWEARIPNGYTPNGFRDGNGNMLSRDAYKREHLIDPKACWRWLKAGRPMGKAQPSREPLPELKPTPEDTSKPHGQKSEMELLKENEMQGRMGRTEYLTALMSLLKAGKVTKEYYDQEVDRVIVGM